MGHAHAHGSRAFIPLGIAVLTVSGSLTTRTDICGALLSARLRRAGHFLAERVIVPADVHQIRAVVCDWIVDPRVDAMVTLGGTGLTGCERTPEAIAPLLDRSMEGFGELFRLISRPEIGTSALGSRALAGVANGTVLFCLPGSPGACRTAWDHLISPQLDNRTLPSNLVEAMPRMLET